MPQSSSELLTNKRALFAVAVLVVLGAVWFLYGSYGRAVAPPLTEDAAAHKAASDAAKSSSLFKASNPLSGVEANPFEKTKKILNPFEN